MCELFGNMAASPSCLLDVLPQEVLATIPILVDTAGRLALFATCTTLRDLVLRTSHSVTLLLKWPLPETRVAPARASLLKACQHSPQVNLELMASDEHPVPLDMLDALFTFDHSTAPPHRLDRIKSVTMENVNLHRLVPLWLSTYCTQVTSLHLYQCRFNLRVMGQRPSGTCSHLTDVVLDYHMSDEHSCDPQLPVEVSNLLCWMWHLGSLPNLQSLNLQPPIQGLPQPLDILRACSSLQLPLAKLTLSSLYSFDPPVLPELPGIFPTLTELDIEDDYGVDDADMSTLLRMSKLQRVTCYNMSLEESFAERLIPFTLCQRFLSVSSLALLPLDKVRREADSTTLRLWTSAEMERAATVAAAMKAGLPWMHDITKLELFTCEDVPVQSLAITISGLTPCKQLKTLCLSRAHVTTELLTSIAPQLVHWPNLSVHFSWLCTFSDDACAALLPALPANVTVVAVAPNRLTEQQFVAMCVGANRPVTIRLGEGYTEPGWKASADKAMHEAGHQHATVVVVPPHVRQT